MGEGLGEQVTTGRAEREILAAEKAAAERARDVDLDLAALERAEEGHAGVPTPRRPGRSQRTVADALAHVRAARAPSRGPAYDIVKRFVDIVIAAILLILAAPVLAALALAIRIDSPGPAIFRQTRVGRNGELFQFFKFRTMYVDARERFPDLYAYDFSPEELPTLYFKLPYDPRCTRVGRWLRRTSLDELPNLLNVLNGSMSLVGPRPEIPEMLPFYEDDQYRKFAVKPGVTGLAQVSGRNILRFVETNALDVEYVDTRSLRRDLTILARTVVAVILMVGAH